MQRFWHALVVALLLMTASASPSQAQSYTLVPFTPGQYFTTSGTVAVCNACRLNAYLTGTTTRRDTYSDTAGTVNANPVVLSATGRATVYLAVGVNYRLVLTDSTGGTTYWDIDPVTAVPSSAGNTDITATAGEALALGDVVYLSDGTGSLTSGRWYQADADNTFESSTAGIIGMATAAIASAGTGTVRIAGRMTGLSGLTTGELYYVSATAAALTVTPPSNQRFIGQADSTTTLDLGVGVGTVILPDSDGTHRLAFITSSNLTEDRRLVINPGDVGRQLTLSGDASLDQNVLTNSTPTFNYTLPCQGRLTLTSGTAVTTSDVTAAGTLYYTPYDGNQCWVYDGTTWLVRTFSEISLAITCTASNTYDVWVYNNAGTLTLATLIWTNETTRATAIVRQNGVYVQSGTTTRRYVGSFYCTATNQTEDSFARRMLWNYYHRVPRPMRVLEGTTSWTYTTDTWRQANGATGNQLDFVVGVAEVPLEAHVMVSGRNSTANISFFVGIGIDSTTAQAAGVINSYSSAVGVGVRQLVTATLRTFPAIGRHTAVWLERAEATGTTTWEGIISLAQAGIVGSIEG